MAVSCTAILLVIPPIDSRLTCQTKFDQVKMDTPQFSAMATTVYKWEDKVRFAVSPDGKKRVGIQLIDDNSDSATVTVYIEKTEVTANVSFGIGTEVLWSQDSKAFVLTGSDEGANGEYEAEVFYLQKNRLVPYRLTKLVVNAFGFPVNCSFPEYPNVVAVKWLVPSERLLVAAQIVHHTNCDSFGTFKAYSVDLSEHRIIKVYNQIAAKKNFPKDLGGDLLDSDDNCIRKPKSCELKFNHPSR